MLYHPNSKEHPFLSVRLGGIKLQPDPLETFKRTEQSQERTIPQIYFFGGGYYQTTIILSAEI